MAQQHVDVRIHVPGLEERFPHPARGRTMRFSDETLPALVGVKARTLELDVRLWTANKETTTRLRDLTKMAEFDEDCSIMAGKSEIQSYFNSLAGEAAKLPAKDNHQRYLAESLATSAKHLFASREARHGALGPRIVVVDASQVDPTDPDYVAESGFTRVMEAAAKGDVVQLREILRRGGNPNLTCQGCDFGDSALMMAVTKLSWSRADKKENANYLAIVKLLLADPRTDPDVRSGPLKQTPLMRAMTMPGVAEMLLAAGADPNATTYNDETSPLYVAAKAGANPGNDGRMLAIVLASKRLDVNRGREKGDPTVLMRMASGGVPEVLTKLLEAGADPNSQTKYGDTALYSVTANAILNPKSARHKEAFTVIASWPGTRRLGSYKGKTVLDLAAEAGRSDLVGELEKLPP